MMRKDTSSVVNDSGRYAPALPFKESAHSAPPNRADTARNTKRQRRKRFSPRKAMSDIKTAKSSFMGADESSAMPGSTETAA